MTFSLRVNNDLSVAELAALARTAEQVGFDQLWVSNDLFLRSAPVLVAGLAARTERIKLGTAIMNPYSMHVAELAMFAATMQEASGGRFLLGVGAGSAEFLGWAGIDRDKPLTTTAQSVAALRTLLGHRDVAAADLPEWFGDECFLRFPLPHPERPVPVYVGGMGPKMLEMAGRLADGVLPLLYPPEHFVTAKAQVDRGLAAAGRSRAAFDLPACIWVSVSADSAAGKQALAEKLAYYGPSISAYLLAKAGLAPAEFAPAAELAQRGELARAAALIDERMLSLGIAGGPDEVTARCRSLQQLGSTHLSFGPPLGPDPLAAVRILGEQVLPQLVRSPEQEQV